MLDGCSGHSLAILGDDSRFCWLDHWAVIKWPWPRWDSNRDSNRDSLRAGNGMELAGSWLELNRRFGSHHKSVDQWANPHLFLISRHFCHRVLIGCSLFDCLSLIGWLISMDWFRFITARAAMLPSICINSSSGSKFGILQWHFHFKFHQCWLGFRLEKLCKLEGNWLITIGWLTCNWLNPDSFFFLSFFLSFFLFLFFFVCSVSIELFICYANEAAGASLPPSLPPSPFPPPSPPRRWSRIGRDVSGFSGRIAATRPSFAYTIIHEGSFA